MREEVESAANFVADLLSRPQTQLPISDQLQRFRVHLIQELLTSFSKHWFPEQPSRGQAFRCLRINHKMDPLLTRVGVLAGLTSDHLRQLLPDELTLWIDPQEVSYRIGENGSICHLLDDNYPTTAAMMTSMADQRLLDRQTPSPNASLLSSSSAMSSLSSSPSLNYWSSDAMEMSSTLRHSFEAKKFYLNSFMS